MTPSEIARETLRRLAQQRIPPTPDNYRTLYHDIAGTPATEVFPEKAWRALAAALPRNTPEQQRFIRLLDGAIGARTWERIQDVLTGLLDKLGAAPPNWAALIRELLLRLETRQVELTPARKREALEHVLASAGSPEILYTRLQRLLKNWAQGSALEAVVGVPPATTPPGTPATPAVTVTGTTESDSAMELLALLAQLLENVLAVVLHDDAKLAASAARLAANARAARSGAEIADFIVEMKRFSYRLHFVAEDQAEIRAGLLHLLRLVIDNISELVIDDQWLKGQIITVLEVVDQPLDLRRIDAVERRMKDVIYKQSALKQSLVAAQSQLKAMLASFVDRLADFSAATGSYHDKLEIYAERISRAGNITELTSVLEAVMQETRSVQLDTRRTLDELEQMRHKADAAEQEVERLQRELASASELVRHDPLTGTLNRRGMDEALTTEISRAHRHGSPLCLALLDIDNFKRLNDTLGHAAGDAALVHLASVVKSTIRPEDILARYGGEEFVVLLPNTALADAVTAMTRVQRELTRRFFLHNNEKVLITFSCGIAEIGADETAPVAFERADRAMYLAKRAGKNRVLAA